MLLDGSRSEPDSSISPSSSSSDPTSILDTGSASLAFFCRGEDLPVSGMLATSCPSSASSARRFCGLEASSRVGELGAAFWDVEPWASTSCDAIISHGKLDPAWIIKFATAVSEYEVCIGPCKDAKPPLQCGRRCKITSGSQPGLERWISKV